MYRLGAKEDEGEPFWKSLLNNITPRKVSKKKPMFPKSLIELLIMEEEEEQMAEEERNDVYIYKTLRYPPKSKPPTAN